MEENVEQFNAEQLLMYIPKGYELSEITDNKIVLVKKQLKSKYPKIFAECCDILYPNENFQSVAQPIKGHNGKKLYILQKLLICRDAYWKIAGDEMGLNKPWEPEWQNTVKYCVESVYGHIDCRAFNDIQNCILAFPTEEMRDVFYENFKDWIEECKELL